MRVAPLLLALAASAQAQDRIPAKVDFFQGPIVSSNRVVGLGGAYIGVAEGADGHLINPAAFAVRHPYAANDWFDWDVALSWLNVADTADTDIDQSGRGGKIHDTVFVEVGGNLKFGRHGFGLHFAQQSFTRPSAEGSVIYRQSFGGPGYALALADTDWTVGAGLLVGAAAVEVDGEDLVSVEGGGLIFGALWRPRAQPFRFGVTARSRIVGEQVKGDANLVGDQVPEALEIPWQVGVGTSVLLGRRYNHVPAFGVGAAPIVARGYLLVSTDLVATGPVRDATGVQAFLAGERQPSGRSTSYSLRLGAEAELVDDRLIARAGGYYEPNRFAGFSGRFHGTAGLDLRVTLGWDWKLSTVVDGADQYTNFGFGLGFWH